MYVVRETLLAKPGMASKMAKAFKSMADMVKGRYTIRVMTDVIGPFNTVVFDTEVATLDDLKKLEEELMGRDDVREAMKGYTDMYLTGKREVFQLV
jgi:hypothetical protein